MDWMIYGANGYTGELIAREARRRGMSPVLAGRSAAPVQALASELGLTARTFSLDDPEQVREGLEGISLVLHCAGPFSATSAPMIEGCLAAGAHYLDITGEIDVFLHAREQHQRACERGVVICPGVGFDVIPTDCVAACLKDLMADATHLALGFDTASGLSHGTAMTTVEFIGKGGRARRNGEVVAVPMAEKVRRIDFGAGEKTAMTIPWGDVATAFETTGIANIDVYIPVPAWFVPMARLGNLLRPLLASRPVQWCLRALVDRFVSGPDERAREKLDTAVWGEVRNEAGHSMTVRIGTANGYALTVTGSLAVVTFLLDQHAPAGYSTPARLMGASLVESLPGSGAFQVEDHSLD